MSETPRESDDLWLNEEWFLGELDKDTPDAAVLKDAIVRLAARGATSQAEGRAKLLQDVLADAGRHLEALEVLELRAGWLDEATIRDELHAIIGADADRRAMVDDLGFGRVPSPEAVRRMRTLWRLRPGAPCHDRTWGFGRVRSLDHFERKVEIDFERRPAHRMSFAYAAETLRVLNETHFLCRLDTDRPGLERMARERPGDLVRLVLEGFGPLTVVQLQKELSPRLIPESEWKAFWEAARRQLRREGGVVLPARRTDPLRLVDRHAEAGPPWAEGLATDRDPESILDRIAEAADGGRVGPGDRPTVADRLDFVRRSAGRRHPERAARAALLADSLGIEEFPLASLLASWCDASELLRVVHALPGRHVRPFLSMLLYRDSNAFVPLLLTNLPNWKSTALADVMSLLLEAGREHEVAAAVRERVARRDIDVELLLWLHRNPDRWEAWGLGPWAEFARLALAALEKDHCGDRLKAQNALRDRLEKPEWLARLFNEADEPTRLDLFERYRRCPAWPPLDRRAVLGWIVRARPELEELLREGPAAPRDRPRITSIRSFRNRQEQLRRIVEVEIPKNSREIAQARSYGDLRENFEYKAAKEMQALLMRRRAELEAELKSVLPTAFEDVATDRVGPGVGVDLEHADGRTERVYILGVWDGDPVRNIVSSDSKLAALLNGRAAGEVVGVPGADGAESPARVAAIVPLPDDLRRWVRGED